MTTCNCMGPQNGQPLCPCLMRAIPSASEFVIASTRLVGEFAEWQPIETAPKDSQHVLVIDDAGNRRVAEYIKPLSFRSPGWWATVPGRWAIRATHWMPLPTPPIPAEPV